MYAKGSMKYNFIKPVYFYPDLIALDEYFLPISSFIVPFILPYYIISNYGRIYNIYENKFMATHTDAYGYQVITFFLHNEPNGKRCKGMKLHRLVMLTFHYFPGCENYQVNHKDTNKFHNYESNLEWCTQQENRDHAIKNNLFKDPYGRNLAETILSENQVRGICECLSKGELSLVEIGKIYNTNKYTVSNIKRRVSWIQISKEYFW